MTLILSLVTLVVAVLFGRYFGKSIPGTTIGGLKFALCFWSVVFSAVVAVILLGLFGTFTGGALLCSLGVAGVGAGIGLLIGKATR